MTAPLHHPAAAARVDLLTAFEARCEARALLWRIGEFDLSEAVDVLQHDAVRDGLVERVGQDRVEEIMAAAFRYEREEADRSMDNDMNNGSETGTEQPAANGSMRDDAHYSDDFGRDSNGGGTHASARDHPERPAADMMLPFTAEELDKMRFDPIKFVVPGYIVEGLTLFAGKPKIGKSWLLLHAAIAVARGGFTLGDVHCQEGDVLYCALEDNKRRLQSRMTKLLGTSTWPRRLSFACEMPRLTEGGLDYVKIMDRGRQAAPARGHRRAGNEPQRPVDLRRGLSGGQRASRPRA
jgi:hypothetical protein